MRGGGGQFSQPDLHVEIPGLLAATVSAGPIENQWAVGGGLGPVPEGRIPLLCLDWSLISGGGGGFGERRRTVSYEHLGEGVCPGAGDVAF